MHAKAFIFTVILILFTASSGFAKMLETKQPVKKTKEPKTESVDDKLQKLSEKLKLTEEQKIKVREVLSRSKEEIIKVLDEAGTKIERIDNNTDAEIESLLTEEQKNKFSTGPKEESETDKWLKIYK